MPILSTEIHKEQDIKINDLTQELLKIFPDQAYVVYSDSGTVNGPFVLYVNYKKWMSYIKGFLIGDKLREEKISKANANQQIKKWLKIPQKKKKDLYCKLLILEGFMEGFSKSDQDIMAANTWTLIRERIKNFKLI